MIVVKYSLRCRSSVHNNNNSLQDQDLDEEDSRFGLDKGDDEEEDEEEKRLREYQEENPPKKFKALFQTASAEVRRGGIHAVDRMGFECQESRIVDEFLEN